MPPPPVLEPPLVPSEDDIRLCITNLHQLAGFSPGCLVVSLIYIERLRRSSGAQMLASTWQPMLLIAVIVAQKVRTQRMHAARARVVLGCVEVGVFPTRSSHRACACHLRRAGVGGQTAHERRFRQDLP